MSHGLGEPIRGGYGHKLLLEITERKGQCEMIAGTTRKRQKALVTASQLEALLRQQQFRCKLTGVELTPTLSSLDHDDPRSLGGDDDIRNLQIVLPCVNKAKGTMTTSQFVAMCHAVARHTQGIRTEDTTWIGYTGHPTSG